MSQGSSFRKRFDPYADLVDITASPKFVAPTPRNHRSHHEIVSLVSDSDDDDDDETQRSASQRSAQSRPGPPAPLVSSRGANRGGAMPPPPATTAASSRDAFGDHAFGASILKQQRPQAATPRKKANGPPSLVYQPPTSSQPKQSTSSFSSFIKPSKGFAQPQSNRMSSPFNQADAGGYENGWPSWALKPGAIASLPSSSSIASSPDPEREKEEVEENGENFDLDQAKITAEDFQRHIGDADEQMRDLLAGAVGDGEDESREPGDDIVEGFADNIKLMPHQVRGVKWMRDREKGRKYGGILADDMGLGKTVQTLARIVEGQRTAAEKKVYKGGTLIIAPLAVMDQWANECKSKTQPGLLKVTTHHGASRTKSGKELEKFDVVITTYDILRAEYNAVQKKTAKPVNSSDSDSDAPKKRKPKPKAAPGSLFDVKWYRIVVDEAQNIKNHKTQTAKAAVELRAKYRWCLTGTPIQNNVEELYSLFKFLRARPLDDWQTFKERISSQVKEGRTGIAMKRLHIILKSIMLRRTKNATIDGKPILNLPARNVNVVECQFDADEQAFYDALEHKTNLTMNRYLRSGTAMSNYTSVLSMLLRLRQACDHPALVTKSLAIDKDALDPEPEKPDGVDKDTADLVDMFARTGIITEAKCEICFVVLEDQTKSQCPDCWDITRRSREKSVEPGDLPPSSAKIRKMLELLNEIDERSQKKEKTIIFSQFTSFLDIIEPFLRDAGIPHVRYDGSLRADQREAVLSKIRTSKTVRVILISFKAGSTGLNLTCCNNVILMDLWWNPALEDQAFDRAHRLGQKLDVHIHKLTIAETVENRILQLQDSKRELANAALSGTSVKNMKLSMADILKLFQRSTHDEDD